MSGLAGKDDICRIVTFSGGGVRGAFSAKVLQNIWPSLNVKVRDKNLYNVKILAGTSTGSLICGAIAMGWEPNRILYMYEELSKKIFKLPWWHVKPVKSLFGPVYDLKKLIDIMKSDEFFGRTKLGDLQHNVIMCSFDLDTMYEGHRRSKPKWFNNFVEDEANDCDLEVYKAAAASAAAPYYFRSKHNGDGYYVDGGIVANHPGAVARTYAELFWHYESKDLRILSIGTADKPAYVSWWNKNFNALQAAKFIFEHVVVRGNVSCTHFYLLSLKERYYYIDCIPEEEIDLDDYKKIPKLKHLADKYPFYKEAKAYIENVFHKDIPHVPRLIKDNK